MWIIKHTYDLKKDGTHEHTTCLTDDLSPLVQAVEACAVENPGRVICGVGEGDDSICFVGPLEGL